MPENNSSKSVSIAPLRPAVYLNTKRQQVIQSTIPYKETAKLRSDIGPDAPHMAVLSVEPPPSGLPEKITQNYTDQHSAETSSIVKTIAPTADVYNMTNKSLETIETEPTSLLLLSGLRSSIAKYTFDLQKTIDTAISKKISIITDSTYFPPAQICYNAIEKLRYKAKLPLENDPEILKDRQESIDESLEESKRLKIELGFSPKDPLPSDSKIKEAIYNKLLFYITHDVDILKNKQKQADVLKTYKEKIDGVYFQCAGNEGEENNIKGVPNRFPQTTLECADIPGKILVGETYSHRRNTKPSKKQGSSPYTSTDINLPISKAQPDDKTPAITPWSSRGPGVFISEQSANREPGTSFSDPAVVGEYVLLRTYAQSKLHLTVEDAHRAGYQHFSDLILGALQKTAFPKVPENPGGDAKPRAAADYLAQLAKK